MDEETKNISVGFAMAALFEDFKSLEDQASEIIFLATGGDEPKDGAK